MITYQSYLKDHQYKTADNLNARIALHRQFGTNPYGWQKWVFDLLNLQSGMQVLEVGCGPGGLWSENIIRCPGGLQVVICDYSLGMLESARSAIMEADYFYCANIDAQAIPFPDNYFTRVIANHMLYHVPDIDLAIAELWRVLTPGGILYASTNGIGHMRELSDLIKIYKPGYQGTQDQTRRFSLENSQEILGKFFSQVDLKVYAENLIVNKAEPLINYILSCWETFDDAERDQLRALEEHIRGILVVQGAFHISKSQGIAIAWK